ncbi:MAG: hypothetical protein R2731_09345 [Nocardioides sp.]
MTRCDEVVVLTLATVLGVAATARWCARHPRGHLRVLVRGAGVDLDDVADATGVRVVGAMASQRGLDEAVDLGLGPVRARRGPLFRAARDVLADGARAA